MKWCTCIKLGLPGYRWPIKILISQLNPKIFMQDLYSTPNLFYTLDISSRWSYSKTGEAWGKGSFRFRVSICNISYKKCSVTYTSPYKFRFSCHTVFGFIHSSLEFIRSYQALAHNNLGNSVIHMSTFNMCVNFCRFLNECHIGNIKTQMVVDISVDKILVCMIFNCELVLCD